MSASLVVTLLIGLFPNLDGSPTDVAAALEHATLQANARADAEEAAEDLDDEGALDDDAPTPVITATVATSSRTRAAIDDRELARLWSDDRAKLGSLSIGIPGAGRLVNGQQFQPNERWTIVDPPNTYATKETIEYMSVAMEMFWSKYPDSAPLRINHISAKDGGYLPPHSTHQVGRDVDLGFYHRTVTNSRGRIDNRAFCPEKNWALLRSIITTTDVEVILVDHRIQRVLYDYALSIGEDRGWLDSLFRAGRSSLVQHARRHRDHFHVRFYNPVAQELGRRVQPLLGLNSDEPQLLRHRIRSGDSLGRIAMKYGVTITAIKRANRMRSDFLRAGSSLVVPIRGKCVHCPVAPELKLPPRRLPPERHDS